MEDEHKRALVLAWHTAALGRVKEMPPLDRLLGRSIGAMPQAQTPDQQRTVLSVLSARYGIPLRKTRLVPVNG